MGDWGQASPGSRCRQCWTALHGSFGWAYFSLCIIIRLFINIYFSLGVQRLSTELYYGVGGGRAAATIHLMLLPDRTMHVTVTVNISVAVGYVFFSQLIQECVIFPR